MNKPLATIATAGLLVLTACAGSGVTDDTQAADSSDYPVTIETCGHKETFESAPSRVVAQPHNLVEVLAALGVSDRVVGYSVFDKTFVPLDKYKEKIANIPELGHGPLSREIVVDQDPDLLYSQINYGGTMVDEYGSLDIPLVFTTQYCPKYAPAKANGDPNVLQGRYNDILDLGRIFDTQDQAKSLVKTLKKQIATTHSETKNKPNVKVASLSFYEGADGPALANNNQGMTHALIEVAGGVNVYRDLKEDYEEISIESLIDRQPDVIVIEDPGSGESKFEDVRDHLRDDPRLADLPAVRDNRFTFARTDETFAGIRFPDAAARFATAFHPDIN